MRSMFHSYQNPVLSILILALMYAFFLYTSKYVHKKYKNNKYIHSLNTI